MPRFLGPVLTIGAISLITVSLIDGNLQAPPEKGVGAKQTSQASRKPADTRTVAIAATRGTHFVADAHVDGRSVEFLVDTGASLVTLRESEAANLGYRPNQQDYRVRISTANGEGRAAAIVLGTVEVGEIMVRDVPALVVADDALAVNLLGMSFLSRVRWRYEEGELVLEQ
jgi:aspartyl protease family protein